MAQLKRYSQQDPQWKSQPLGFDNSSAMGGYGCLLTSMAMVASVYGFTDTPDSLNNKMKNVSGFQGAYVIPYLIAKALPGMIYRNYIECQNQPAPLAEIDAYLNQGKPVIVEVDFSPKEGLQNHWIVLYAKSGSDYLIADPWPYPIDTKDVTLATRYGFGGPAAQIIQAVLWLDGPAGAVQPPPPPPLNTSVVASFKVYATVDDLAIRSQTLVSDATLVKRVPMNTEFSVLEADATAKPKVGQMNQWLAVKAADGTTGYAAAWYVSLAKATAPATPPPATPAQPTVTTPSVVVKTTTDGVALRTQPQTTDATLIKRLPLNTELKVYETAADANRKIGTQYEWLSVKDVTGQAGFVAAWYVALVPNPALGANPQTPAASPHFDINAEVPPVLLRVQQDGLALRSQPLIDANTLVKRLPINTELIAIEPPDIAAPKIGHMGDWIHVRDVTGEEGYVAAWYVVERPAEPDPSVGPADS